MTETELLASIEDYRRPLLKICHVYRNTVEDRKDLFQDIIYELFRSRESFQGRSSIRTGMYKIAYYTAIAPLRTERPEFVSTSLIAELRDTDQERLNQKEDLVAAMHVLTDEDKTILTLYMEQFNYEEIAEIMGIDANHVGVRLYRIKKKIRNFLNKKA